MSTSSSTKKLIFQITNFEEIWQQLHSLGKIFCYMDKNIKLLKSLSN